MPARIQRKRTKDWRMPANTVYVGRSTEFGNPFVVGSIINGAPATVETVVELFKLNVLAEIPPLQSIKRNAWKLRGKNLACWCAEGERCHADVLLEIANGQIGTP